MSDGQMPDATRGRLAFVPPRYGTEIVGGSEAVMREAAHGLAAPRLGGRGAHDLRARSLHLAATSTSRARPPHDDGVVVHRFPVVGSKPQPSRGTHRGAHPVGRGGAARRPARVARRPVPRPRPLPPSRRQLRPLRRGDPVAVSLLDDRHRRDDRSRAHDRDAVPARRAVRAARGAQPGACPTSRACGSCPSPSTSSRTSSRRSPTTSSPARACTCPTSYDPEGFRARHGLDAPVPPVRGPARAGQGLGLAPRRVPLRDPPVRRCRSTS